jgi:glycerophosphoryl diester phosphodiesterase
MQRLAIVALAAIFSAMTARSVEIIAHRGASADAPENTLAAIQAAWAQGADAIELDLWLSKDGKLIVFHDSTTKRFEGTARNISGLTLVEARQLDVGAWKGARFRGERVPLLEEILATIPAGKRAVIEIKCGPEIVPELARVLRAAGRPAAQTCVISFSHDALLASKTELPELQHYLLAGWKVDAKTGKGPELPPLIAKAREAKFDGLNLNHEWPVDAAAAAQVNAAGLKLLVWTVNDANVARRWIAAGVQAITTDRPGALREELKETQRRLPAMDHAKGQVRVVSYNILGGRNPDGAHDLSRIAGIIRALNPDLVALQEVDVRTKRFRGRDLPAELAALTGMRAFFAEAMPFDGGSYGCAALSRLPVESHKSHALPAREKSEPRAAIELLCRLHAGADAPKLRFIGTHLDHQNAEDDRLLQTAKLAALFPDPASPPSVLAGDFNAEPAAASLKPLAGKWALTWPAGRAPATWPAVRSRAAIDHVFTAGPWEIRSARTALEAFPGDARWKAQLEAASDHLPIVVELRLP